MNMTLKIVHSIISRALMFIVILIMIVPLILCLLVPARWRLDNPVLYMIGKFFYWATLKITFIPIIYKGTQNMVQEPAIIVANHQSSLDITLIGNLMGLHQHTWLATNLLLKSVMLRYLLLRTCILVDDSSPTKAMRSLIKAIAMVNGKPRHIIVFPEGGRFDDGEIHDFYGGFVILAKKMGRPVVPIRIFHANEVYPQNSFWIYWHTITVVVGKPFVYQETDTDESFKQRVRQWFIDQKEE